ncbi:MAG TPA: hypothetical protein VFE62_25985 [Gemmataceae bacterium]|nr:hypothetical protein [Gemmataceae bacterium]
MHWLVGDAFEAQVVCEDAPGSRFRAAVDIEGLLWTGDLNAGLACARKHDRRVFLAIHAVADTNARYNELTAFREPRVRTAMKRYLLVMLHVDWVPPAFLLTPTHGELRKVGEANLKFEQVRFGTLQEPLYAVLQPTGDGDFHVVGIHDQVCLRDTERFESFLHYPHVTPRDGWWRSVVDKVQSAVKKAKQ